MTKGRLYIRAMLLLLAPLGSVTNHLNGMVYSLSSWWELQLQDVTTRMTHHLIVSVPLYICW